MKNFITSYLLKFAFVATILVIIFRYFLSYGIENESRLIIVLSSVSYSICMFIAGFYFGKKDGNFLPIYDVGFRFHFTTYLVHNIISELWFILKFNSGFERIERIHQTVIIWGILLLIHFIIFMLMRKKSFKGLDKKELFE
jgi:hypothetical protein